MTTVLVVLGAAAVAGYAAHLWFDPHTLRGRWRETYPNHPRKHRKDKG